MLTIGQNHRVDDSLTLFFSQDTTSLTNYRESMSETLMSDLAFTVVGGLIVAVLIWAWNNVLPPVMQRFYRDEPTIGGKWRTTFREGNREYRETVTLKQRGRRVRGEIVLHEPPDEVTTYKFEGRFKYLILTGTYQSTDPSDYEQGAFALKYTRQNTFVGQYVLFSKQADHLISSPYEWERA